MQYALGIYLLVVTDGVTLMSDSITRFVYWQLKMTNIADYDALPAIVRQFEKANCKVITRL